MHKYIKRRLLEDLAYLVAILDVILNISYHHSVSADISILV